MRVKFILGSRSPRRLELLGQIVPTEQIEVLAPRSSKEAGFDGLQDWTEIVQRLAEIARTKNEDVWKQISTGNRHRGDAESCVVITADTAIIATDETGCHVVLGKPPAENPSWPIVVRSWFRDYYAGRTHMAATAVCVTTDREQTREQIVLSRVTFTANVERWLDWYLATGEPLGKAGGYAIQGIGSIFVSEVQGSLSNVVGLPLRELLEMLDALGVLREQ